MCYRKTHFNVGKAKAKQQWLRQFEELVIAKAPQHAGKIEWDTPIHFFNNELRIEDAVDLYIHRRKDNA